MFPDGLQFPRAVIPETFLSLFTLRNKNSDLGFDCSHERLPCSWCRAGAGAEKKLAGSQDEGPRGQEMLLPASLEAERWEGGGTGQNRVCPHDQAAQEAWAAGGHGRNTLRLEAKWVHPVLPQNGAHTPGWRPRLLTSLAVELCYRGLCSVSGSVVSDSV